MWYFSHNFIHFSMWSLECRLTMNNHYNIKNTADTFCWWVRITYFNISAIKFHSIYFNSIRISNKIVLFTYWEYIIGKNVLYIIIKDTKIIILMLISIITSFLKLSILIENTSLILSGEYINSFKWVRLSSSWKEV